MTRSIRPLVAGNWKMNGLQSVLAEFDLMGAGNDVSIRRSVDLMICPPATLISALAHAAIGQGIAIGAQDCHSKDNGAHTGDISAQMLADAGASAVIVGHSERRADHGETDASVRLKAEAAYRNGLMAIICVGETRAEREAGKTLAVVRRQLKGSVPDGMTARDIVIAYFGGDHAREVVSHGEREAIEIVLSEFTKLVGAGARKAFERGSVHAWSVEPYSLGCYSHALPGHADARAKLSRPVGDRIFFAGEATPADEDFGGAMTAGGAALAGREAVREAAKLFG